MSLDSLDDEVFRAMNDVDFPVARVLAGIDAAAGAGLPVKVNVVVKRGLNEDSVLEIARRFRGTGHAVRFIEFMDVGATNGWRMDDVVPAAEIVATIGAEFPLEPVEAAYRGEVAQRYRYRDGAGEIGVIASVTQPLLRRLHARAALGRRQGLHLPVRRTRSRPARHPSLGRERRGLDAAIRAIWERRTDRYSELRPRRPRACARWRCPTGAGQASPEYGGALATPKARRPQLAPADAGRCLALARRPCGSSEGSLRRDTEHGGACHDHLQGDGFVEDEPGERDGDDRVHVGVRRDEDVGAERRSHT